MVSFTFVFLGAGVFLFATAKIGFALLRSWNHSMVCEKSLEVRAGHQWLDIDRSLRHTMRTHSIALRPAVWRNVMVTRVQRESADVKSFYLVDPDGMALNTFLPGQHIVVQRQGHGTLDDDSRCYSLSADSSESFWRISVKRQSDHPGSFSRWLCDEVNTGDILRVRGPSGSFYLNSIPQHNVVLANAGIGITPLIPMLIECLRREYPSIHVFAQFRDPEHMPFALSLLDLASKNKSVRLQLWISRLPTHVKGGDSDLFRLGKFGAGEMLEAVSKHGLPDTPTDFYFCGPEAWQENLKSDLITHGVEGERIHYELFESPGSHSSKPAENAKPVEPHKVVFAQSGAVTQFEPTHPSLLHCASKNKVSIDSGCRAGACGACAVKMLEGKVRYTKSPQFHTKPNEILTCICVPETDLVVDA